MTDQTEPGGRADQRSFQIALTTRGHEVVDAALAERAANLARLEAPLSPADRAAFDGMLRALLRGLE